MQGKNLKGNNDGKIARVQKTEKRFVAKSILFLKAHQSSKTIPL